MNKTRHREKHSKSGPKELAIAGSKRNSLAGRLMGLILLMGFPGQSDAALTDFKLFCQKALGKKYDFDAAGLDGYTLEFRNRYEQFIAKSWSNIQSGIRTGETIHFQLNGANCALKKATKNFLSLKIEENSDSLRSLDRIGLNELYNATYSAGIDTAARIETVEGGRAHFPSITLRSNDELIVHLASLSDEQARAFEINLIGRLREIETDPELARIARGLGKIRAVPWRKVVATEQSGFLLDPDVAENPFRVFHWDIQASDLISSSVTEQLVSIRVHQKLFDSQETKDKFEYQFLRRALESPLTPVMINNGYFIVYGRIAIPVRIEVPTEAVHFFYVFRTRELADAFVGTHQLGIFESRPFLREILMN